MNIQNLAEKAIRIIEEGFPLLSGIDELAERVGVTKCHLIRVFKAQTGVSPGCYLVATRLNAAKLLLAHRGYSVEAIAHMVGYSGANYFCKAFKRDASESPLAYRARHAPAVPAGKKGSVHASRHAPAAPVGEAMPGVDNALSEKERALLDRLDRMSHT